MEVGTFDAIRFDFDAIRFDFDAIRFDFDAIRFAAKALRFPFVGPRLQRDHRRNLREGFAFDFDAIRFRLCAIKHIRAITRKRYSRCRLASGVSLVSL